MKILIHLTSLADNFSGIERYALNISKQLLIKDKVNKYLLIFKNEVYCEFEEIIKNENVEYKVIFGKNKLLFNQVILPYNLYKLKAEKYIFLAFPSPIMFRRKGIISAIHDLTAFLYPETMNFKSRLYFKYSIIDSIKKSDLIITVSESSKLDLIKKFGEKINIKVISNGISDTFINFKKDNINEDLLKVKYNLPNEYILSLGTIEPRKNIKLLIESYLELKKYNNDIPKLVLVGRKGWKLEEIFRNINIEKYKSDIIFTGFVEDNDLPYIYTGAKFFIFPSLYEGFGIPVIEAIYMGTPTIISDIKSLREITNNKSKTFKSNNKEDLKNSILEYIGYSNSDLLKDANNLKAEVIKYDWSNEGNKLLDIIDSKKWG